MYYLSYNFAVRPLNFQQFHNRALLLRINPQNFSSPRNMAPGAVVGAGGGIPVRSGGGVGRGRAWGGPGVP
jgi:hypothetical protein